MRLRSEAENSKFWQYRCDDVSEQLRYLTIIIGVLAIRGIIEFLSVRDTTSAMISIEELIMFSLHAILWFNRKRVGNKFAIYMITLLLLSNVQRIVTAYFQIKLQPELDNIQKTIILKRNLEFLKQKAMFAAMFSCPSMSYFIVMLLGFFLSMFILSFGLVGLSD